MNARVEDLVTALLNGETVTFTPHSRTETYLIRCIEGGGTDGLPMPVSRLDALLYKLAEKIEGGFGPEPGTGGGEVSDEDIATDEEVNSVINEVFDQ